MKDQATMGAGQGSSLRTPASPRDCTGLSDRVLPPPSPKQTLAVVGRPVAVLAAAVACRV